jgi:hypothetical protein
VLKGPRDVLNDGSLVDLCEREEWETTEIFGNVAQRFLAYRKTRVLRGERFDARGMNTIQFVRKDGDWKMSALAWDDERNGELNQRLNVFGPTAKCWNLDFDGSRNPFRHDGI